MARTTHDRLNDHFGHDISTNINLYSSLPAPASTVSGQTVQQALLDLNTAIAANSGGGYPQITGSGNGQITFEPDGSVKINDHAGARVLEVNTTNGYTWVLAEHTPGDFADKGVNLEAGTDDVGIWVSEKDASTVQFYPDVSGGYDIELKDRGGKHWKSVGTNGTYNLNDYQYNPVRGEAFTGTGATAAFTLAHSPAFGVSAYVSGLRVAVTSVVGAVVTLSVTPANTAPILMDYEYR